MLRRSIIIPLALLFFSLATILIGMVQAVQITLGTLPPENARIATAPVSHFTHAIGGVLFGLIGPLQFGRVLAKKFGRIHRILGRVFVASGAALVISSFSLLWQFPSDASPLVSGGRLMFGAGLAVALILAMKAIQRRDFACHRDWMIRAYALGIGATAVSMVFIPIYAITGEPPTGFASDVAFIGSWAFCVALAEWIVRSQRSRSAAQS
jgi:uncharacterized membrane protein